MSEPQVGGDGVAGESLASAGVVPAWAEGAGDGATSSEPRLYYPALDGLRFLAFLLVYWFHRGFPQVTAGVNRAARWVSSQGEGLAWIPRDLGLRWEGNGWVGVEIFFTLSGFLIATLLLREEEKFGRIDWRSFWVRRILRIWPLYYTVLLLALTIVPWSQGQLGGDFFNNFLRQQLAAFLLFLGNWSMAFRGAPPNDMLSVLWSVCVEEQFYLLAPIVLVLVPKRWRMGLVVALIGAGIFSRYELARRGAPPLLFQFGSITHLDTLLSGVLLAMVVHPRGAPRKGWSAWVQVAEVVMLVLFVVALSQRGLSKGNVGRQTWDLVVVWGLTVGLLAIMVRRKTALGTALSNPRIVWLGKVSYGLYMLHEFALWGAKLWFQRMGWFPNKEVLETIAAFALTLILAGVSYYFLERPFLRLKRGWTRVPSRPV